MRRMRSWSPPPRSPCSAASARSSSWNAPRASTSACASSSAGAGDRLLDRSRRPAGFAALAERAVAMARVVPEDPHAGLADAPDGLVAADLDLADPDEPNAEALIARAAAAEDAALAVPGVTNSEGAERRLGAQRHRAGRQQRLRRRTMPAPAIPSRPPRWPGRARRWSATTTIPAAVHLADLEDPADARPPRRGEGGGAAEPDAGRRPRASPWCSTRAWRRSLLGHLSGAINGASVARGTCFLRDQLGQRVMAAGADRGGRPDPAARPALPPLRRRGHGGQPPRDRRGRRADHLDPRLAQRPAARHGLHRPCQPRHRRPARPGDHQPVARARAA